jgi:SAM-dependent methyltransferase
LLGKWLARGSAAATARACPVCRDARRLRAMGSLATTGEIVFDRKAYDLVECGRCDLVYLSPMPSGDDLDRIYLGSSQFTDDLYTDPQRVAAILEYMTSCLTRMLARAGKTSRSRIATLEVGAGLAWMARAAKSLNTASATTAQDISGEAAGHCPWVDHYVRGDIRDPRLDAGAPYDVVSLTHVIEHLPEPIPVLARCKALLADGGTILVTAPHRPPGWRRGVSDAALWRTYSYNHVPAHIQYFSRKSMTAFARTVGCELAFFDDRSEGGQAFEAWLR